MAKNIVVFSDGTGEQGGVRPDQVLTNVYKLYRASRVSGDNVVDAKKQVAFYDPGLGTVSDGGMVRLSILDRFKAFAGLFQLPIFLISFQRIVMSWAWSLERIALTQAFWMTKP